MEQDIRYRFGKNWKGYLRDHFNEENIALAKKSLQQVFKLVSFEGKTFLDIGCGSGLFSYAALQLGAKRVFSFDFDKDSVECCLSLKESAGNPAHWDVTHGSILDDEFVADHGQFDLVYSFGVLHHTGNMWKAIENASRFVQKKGLFYFAIYNKVEYRTLKQYRGSYFWLRVKRAFNTNRFYRVLILAWYLPLASVKLVFNWVITGKHRFANYANMGGNVA